MREFFRGWKRKVGCVTLGFACVFMAGWVRSQNNLDHLSLNLDDETIHGFSSTPYGIEWLKERTPGVQWFTGKFRATSYRITPESYARLFERFPATSNVCGFRSGSGESASAIVIPYWSIVLPLILLSAWLLLSKPKQKSTGPTQQKVALLDGAEGVL